MRHIFILLIIGTISCNFLGIYYTSPGEIIIMVSFYILAECVFKFGERLEKVEYKLNIDKG